MKAWSLLSHADSLDLGTRMSFGLFPDKNMADSLDDKRGSSAMDDKRMAMEEQRRPKITLEGLSFPEEAPREHCSSDSDNHVPCLFCNRKFVNTEVKNDALLHHLLVEHQLVIADVSQVCDMKRYSQHWKERFKEGPITEYCTVININSKPTDIGPKVQYYLLCDTLPEDRQLREKLQKERLVHTLESQQRERSDTHFSRTCLFCKQVFEGNRSFLFDHMADDHGFSVGLPDNIVHVNGFLDLLEKKLNNLQCLYCEKTFKDRPTLKDHMRKKQHKKINPQNKEYDKFYIINYLELGKTWEDIQNENDETVGSKEEQKDDEEDWSDWTEESPHAVCLFCEQATPFVSALLQHMKDSHSFDFLDVKSSLGLDFYHQVKIVNYIRRQVFNWSCICCQEKCQSRTVLLDHMTKCRHFVLPEKAVWNQPQYYFPTYENDVLLCSLEDEEEAEEEGTPEE